MYFGNEKSSSFLKRTVTRRPLWEKNSFCSQCGYLGCSVLRVSSTLVLLLPSNKRDCLFIVILTLGKKVVCSRTAMPQTKLKTSSVVQVLDGI